MKLLGSNEKKRINKNKYGENCSHLEITEILVHCNIVNHGYNHDLRVLHTFVPNKSFGQLLDISAKNFTFFKALYSEFSYIEVWSIDQNSNLLEIEDKINITLIFR